MRSFIPLPFHRSHTAPGDTLREQIEFQGSIDYHGGGREEQPGLKTGEGAVKILVLTCKLFPDGLMGKSTFSFASNFATFALLLRLIEQ